MKAFTDIEQSKKLAEILPLESADMRYGYTAPFEFSDVKYDGGYGSIPYHKNFFNRHSNLSSDECDRELPCWSLSALLDLLPEQSNLSKRYAEDCETMVYWVWISSFDYESEEYTNPIDACVEMVLKLKEEDLL